MKEGDREMLQEMIMAAVNQAHQKASEVAKERIASITGGINIPGLF
jgi:DNA-binding protein YbaB